ncbi:hypothetical protein SSS_05632 [Sarcoptes scabiei]|uniref:Uncharacterized protein n=1 Tax=Sarcoptes scabiei TaxID=52283 RepID=A0A834RGJ4_SARSC|nr:hypothetical protein SSS_05632 [Sarcoptes scabiei]
MHSKNISIELVLIMKLIMVACCYRIESDSDLMSNLKTSSSPFSSSSSSSMNPILNFSSYQNRPRRFISLRIFPKDLMINQDFNKLPMLYIGEVDLTIWPNCSRWIGTFIELCQLQYENLLRNQILQQQILRKQNRMQSDPVQRLKFHRNDEFIKRASCCGIWQAKQCMIDSIALKAWKKPLDCPDDLIERYQNLPDDSNVRADVLDYCSEYSDGSLICSSIASSSIINQRQLSTNDCVVRLLCIILILKLIFTQ